MGQMQTLKQSYTGLALLADLNWDRLIAALAIAASLAAGGMIASL
jgi:hypothetical protein